MKTKQHECFGCIPYCKQMLGKAPLRIMLACVVFRILALQLHDCHLSHCLFELQNPLLRAACPSKELLLVLAAAPRIVNERLLEYHVHFPNTELELKCLAALCLMSRPFEAYFEAVFHAGGFKGTDSCLMDGCM